MNSQLPQLFKENILQGTTIVQKQTYLKDLKGFFYHEAERELLLQNQLVYEVDAYFPVSAGTEGGLFFGVTRLQPGMVGNEYFMTRGHFHAIANRAEYYWTIEGHGQLILMNHEREICIEEMQPGSLHYIPGHMAHRVANTGNSLLSFGACWPADAGYDYTTIESEGFSARLCKVNGLPVLLTDEQQAL
ncbi:glucose-6-phosphate isomerase family protein [Pedobacter sp. Hv1]|uniref:glucose-6-phosphate isomerase family protein n=1 Tax=Pedobacter sp. Hv1 TaxID=1740090 RepID=UPI0006D8B56A|nr:glucose-6-phosphate isomerase family protein [Pedobacter sp. Hv1]KQC02186.1 glucose-6-phosphate isomerase [Pedobacter sp. Hv1]